MKMGVKRAILTGQWTCVTTSKITLFCLLLLPLSLRAYCFFSPPADWLIADPQHLAPRVKIAFIGKTGSNFAPSINLATEEVNVGMDEYLKAVKALHETTRSNRWRDLGTIQTRAGQGRLTSIDTKTEWGQVRLLQMIFIQDHTAYVMTASSLKEEFPRFFKAFDQAFRSLTLTSDLYSSIPQAERRAALKSSLEKAKGALLAALQNHTTASKTVEETAFASPSFQKESWEPFQQMVIRDYADLGAYWQVLFLQTAQEELLYHHPLNSKEFRKEVP